MQKEKSDLRVGIISALDPSDKRSLSGTPYQMYKALTREFSFTSHLGPIKLGKLAQVSISLTVFLLKVYHLIRYGTRIKSLHYAIKSKIHSRYFDKKINESQFDVLFAPVASIEIAYLKTKVPICYHTDATFDQVWPYYHLKKDLTPLVMKMGNSLEQRAINKSNYQIFSSKWAEDHARQFYGASKTSVVKLGANLDLALDFKPSPKTIGAELKLLFIGVEWERKGGRIVLETLDLLLQKGYAVSLTVCGCTPPINHSNIKVIPFLDKNTDEGMMRIKELYAEAHLFFMPTRAETFGVVFCEACAFGMPVISTDTGGVSSIIEDEFNGFLLPKNASGTEYSEVIERVINNKKLYQVLSLNAREKYERELNWYVWGVKIKEILHNIKNINSN